MKKINLCIFLLFYSCVFSQPRLDKVLYGVAYYYEYMPYERLDQDVQMMKECGINVVRVAESTWGVWEPQDGIFDFSKLDRVLDAMNKAGIKVIVGTPTYAIPTWLAKEHPEVLVTTPYGKNKYGARQNMDIVNPVFRKYAERIIRKLISHVKDNPAVIGYQADNETKFYDNSGDTMQAMFLRYLQEQFTTPENLNKAFGLNYWANSINSWKDMPSMDGNINAGLGCEFSKFQREQVTSYLAWQVSLINEYKKPGQFVTHNFDLEWRGYSYGVQPNVDHFAAAKAFDIAGIDIYHPTGSRLTGSEISFGGDVARSLKQDNYLVLETEAQSIAGSQELPYPGQLRLQAYSHFACGANMVEYWPWHSIHSSAETYWKGLLSHDMESNPTYIEARQIGKELELVGSKIINLQKKNKVAVLISNESLTALNWFPFSQTLNYNDVVHQLYDVLYNLNVGCDFVNPQSKNIERYSLLIVPPLYIATDSLLNRLNTFVKNGGHIVFAFKSGFSNENVQVRSIRMPGLLKEACGFSYQQFINIDKLKLRGDPFKAGDRENFVHDWAELLVPATAKVLAYYEHPYYGKYAAITQNTYGKGSVTYLGTFPSKTILRKLMADVVREAGLQTIDQKLAFPLIVKNGVNQSGKNIHYYFNYSGEAHTVVYPYKTCTSLLTGKNVSTNEKLSLDAWGVVILEER
ncbi:MAG: beta-galactosidase [Ginsengibacter sp.]